MKAKNVNTDEQRSEAHAISKFNIVSHKKMNMVCKQIRNLSYQAAIAVLHEVPNRSGKIIQKTIKSAFNNLLQVDDSVTEDQCFVKELQVGTGPNIKRLKPRARGRADIIKKRTSHLKAVVARRA